MLPVSGPGHLSHVSIPGPGEAGRARLPETIHSAAASPAGETSLGSCDLGAGRTQL